MYGLLGYDYFEIHLFENLESDNKKSNIEKIPFKVVQIVLSNAYY